MFCDFGDEFEVSDATGEEPKEIFISNITQANPGIVTCLENHPHKLETGQFLMFREINGMTGLNGSTQQITGKFLCFINSFILIHYSTH